MKDKILQEYVISEEYMQKIRQISACIQATEAVINEHSTNSLVVAPATDRLILHTAERAKWFEEVAEKFSIVFKPENRWEVDFAKDTLNIIT